MPSIDCGLCVLRSWRMQDLDALVASANNRNVWITLRNRFPHPYRDEDGRAWLLASAAESPPTSLAIDVDARVAGGIGLVLGQDVHAHTAELGYWLGEPYWGRGIATAAVIGFLPWAFRTFGLRRVFADVFETNPASMRVLEKSGFVREGVLRQHTFKAGRYLDQVVYGILAPDAT